MTNYFKQDPNYQVSEIKRIKEMFETGGLHRREFLQGLLAGRSHRYHRHRGHYRLAGRAGRDT